jgi:hypothetical protein
MKRHHSTAILIGAAAAFAGPAHAQQPPDPVRSDRCSNTAMGTGALLNNDDGHDCESSAANTAAGYQALYSSAAGGNNTAFGTSALFSNSGGFDNTATGTQALYSNTSGTANTAFGFRALYSETTGTENTAMGEGALGGTSTGIDNTSVGLNAGSATTGSYNTTMGFRAGGGTTGGGNVAIGANSLSVNGNGDGNTAIGTESLYNLPSGSGNIAVGAGAGSSITTAHASNNIDIDNTGEAADDGIIRIGTPHRQKAAYMAGIYDTLLESGSAPVYVNSSGLLSVNKSSERYKTAITPMGNHVDKLQQLRPVAFHLKSEPNGAIQYGLIAEEVDKVYPELVIRDDKGEIQGVRYDELAPMLLHEVQQLNATVKRQAAQLQELEELKHDIADLKRRPE